MENDSKHFRILNTKQFKTILKKSDVDFRIGRYFSNYPHEL